MLRISIESFICISQRSIKSLSTYLCICRIHFKFRWIYNHIIFPFDFNSFTLCVCLCMPHLLILSFGCALLYLHSKVCVYRHLCIHRSWMKREVEYKRDSKGKLKAEGMEWNFLHNYNMQCNDSNSLSTKLRAQLIFLHPIHPTWFFFTLFLHFISLNFYEQWISRLLCTKNVSLFLATFYSSNIVHTSEWNGYSHLLVVTFFSFFIFLRLDLHMWLENWYFVNKSDYLVSEHKKRL